MQNRLSSKLFLALALGLAVIFVAETASSIFIELPALYELERQADARAVKRAQSAVARRLAELERGVDEYGIWDVTYEFMARDRLAPESVYFVNLETGPATHANNHIDGMLLLDLDGNSVHSTYFDPGTGTLQSDLALDPVQIPAALRNPETVDSDGRVGAGIIDVGGGRRIMFAAGLIRDTAETLPARGIIIFWKLIDIDLIADLRTLSDVNLELIPVEGAWNDPGHALRLQQLTSTGPPPFLSRDSAHDSYWLLEDWIGKPVYLVRQPHEPRAFYEGWLTRSSIIGIFSAGLILVCITIFFHKSFVTRVRKASLLLKKIRQSGTYHHRLPVPGDDELSDMFIHLNELLARVEQNEEDLKTQNRQLADLSQRDSLTGIANRRFFNEVLDRSWRQAARTQRSLALLLIDVDHFKPFNDHYGHLRGDRVLKQVAQTLQDNLHRATDFVARYGGEEFCVILTDTDPGGALRVAETLRRAIQELGLRHEYSSCADVVTISIGIASTTVSARIVHLDLVQAADRALYLAKASGRNQVRDLGGESIQSAPPS